MNEKHYEKMLNEINQRIHLNEVKREDYYRHVKELESITGELENCIWQSTQLLGEVGNYWPHDIQLQENITKSMYIAERAMETNIDFFDEGEAVLNNQYKILDDENELINNERRKLNRLILEESGSNLDFRKD